MFVQSNGHINRNESTLQKQANLSLALLLSLMEVAHHCYQEQFEPTTTDATCKFENYASQ